MLFKESKTHQSIDPMQEEVGAAGRLLSEVIKSRFLEVTSMSLSLFSRLSLSFLSSRCLSSLMFCQALSASFFPFSFSLSSCRVALSSSVRDATVWLWLPRCFWWKTQIWGGSQRDWDLLWFLKLNMTTQEGVGEGRKLFLIQNKEPRLVFQAQTFQHLTCTVSWYSCKAVVSLVTSWHKVVLFASISFHEADCSAPPPSGPWPESERAC